MYLHDDTRLDDVFRRAMNDLMWDFEKVVIDTPFGTFKQTYSKIGKMQFVSIYYIHDDVSAILIASLQKYTDQPNAEWRHSVLTSTNSR